MSSVVRQEPPTINSLRLKINIDRTILQHSGHCRTSTSRSRQLRHVLVSLPEGAIGIGQLERRRRCLAMGRHRFMLDGFRFVHR